MIRLYTDAAVKGHPGPAGIGLLILFEDRQIQLAQPLDGDWNNHEAEFEALKQGLQWIIQEKQTNEMLFCYTDSQIVAQSIEKEYAKDVSFQKYVDLILTLLDAFPYASVSWLPEIENKGSDNLARQALQKAIHQKELK